MNFIKGAGNLRPILGLQTSFLASNPPPPPPGGGGCILPLSNGLLVVRKGKRVGYQMPNYSGWRHLQIARTAHSPVGNWVPRN